MVLATEHDLPSQSATAWSRPLGLEWNAVEQTRVLVISPAIAMACQAGRVQQLVVAKREPATRRRSTSRMRVREKAQALFYHLTLEDLCPQLILPWRESASSFQKLPTRFPGQFGSGLGATFAIPGRNVPSGAYCKCRANGRRWRISGAQYEKAAVAPRCRSHPEKAPAVLRFGTPSAFSG
jgi:hypothetical protein